MANERSRTLLVLLVGALLGVLVVPQVAAAVSNAVQIQSGNGTAEADVTKAGQLQQTETAPSNFRVLDVQASGDGQCNQFAAAPAGKGLVVRQVVVTITVPSSAGVPFLAVYSNGTCTGRGLALVSTETIGTTTLPITPGFALASGHRLSVNIVSPGTAAANAFLFGYLVPSADVPSTTPVLG
jgi:hypothetical protein